MDTIIGRLAARLTGDTSDFRKEYEAAATVEEKFERQVKASGATLRTHATQLDNIEKMVTSLAGAEKKAGAEAEDAAKKTEKHTSALKTLQKQAEGVEKTFKAVALAVAGISIAGFAALTGGVVAATKAATDFEASFAGVKRTVGGNAADLEVLSGQFRELAKQIPINVNEINNIGTAAGQLGVQKDQIASFVEVMAKLGVVTNMTADQAADSLARLANITQMPQENFDRLASTVVYLGANSAATESDIVSMALRLAGAGHVVGMTEAQILGLASGLSSVGVEAEAGGTAFSKVFEDMASAVAGSTSEARQRLEDMATVMGVSTSQLKQMFKEDAAGAVVTLVESLGKLQKQGADVFSVLETLGFADVRMRDAILRTAGAGDILRKSIEDGSEAWQENTALTEAAANQFQTVAARATIAEGTLRDVGIEVGGPFKDAFGELLATFGETLKGEDALIKKTIDEFRPAIAGAVKELKPIVKGFAEELPNAIETFGASVITLKGYLDTIGNAWDAMNKKMGTTTSLLGVAGMVMSGIGGALFGDFQADVEKQKRKLRGEPEPPAFSDKGYPNASMLNAQGTPTSSNTIVSGGAVVLKSEAEQRVKDAEEAWKIWREAKDLEEGLVREMAQPPGEVDAPADTFAGAAPESKEDRIKREREAEQAAKKAEQEAAKRQREAEAAAKKAEREAQRAAERYADMLSEFDRALTEGSEALVGTLGKLGAKVGSALGAAFQEGASGSQGAALANNIREMINAAKEAGVEGADEMGEALIAAASNAIRTKTPEAKQAVMDLLQQMNDAIVAASSLTAASFGKAFDKAALVAQLGSTGAAIMDSLNAAIKDGGVKNIEALAKNVVSMRRTLVEDLTPEQAGMWAGQLMDAITTAVETKSPEAIQALDDLLEHMNIGVQLEKAGNAMAEKINVAIQNAAEKIGEIDKNTTKRLQDAVDALTSSRELRGMRETAANAQTKELEDATDAVNALRTAYHDMREDQHILDQRKLDDAELLHKRDLEDTKLQKDFDDAQKLNKLHDTVGMSGVQAAALAERGRAGGFDTGQKADPALDARKALEKKKKDLADERVIEDAEIKRKRGLEDDAKAKQRADRDIDLVEDKKYAKLLDDFKREQKTNFQKFEDDIADQQLKDSETRVRTAAQVEIDKVNQNLTDIETAEQQKFDTLNQKLQDLAAITMGQISDAGATALDPMLSDADDLVDKLHEAEATQQRMGGSGSSTSPVAAGGTSRKPNTPTGGIDDPPGPVGGGDPVPDPPPDPEPDPDPGAGLYAPVEMGDGGYVRRPTLAVIAERGTPEIVAPEPVLQNIVTSAAQMGIRQEFGGHIDQPRTVSSGKIDPLRTVSTGKVDPLQTVSSGNIGQPIIIAPVLHNPQFYGVGGMRQFTRQLASDMTDAAASKVATQGS